MRTIKDIRAECGMTQQEFADKLGCSVRTIQKYDRGEPPKEWLLNLIDYYMDQYKYLEYKKRTY